MRPFDQLQAEITLVPIQAPFHTQAPDQPVAPHASPTPSDPVTLGAATPLDMITTQNLNARHSNPTAGTKSKADTELNQGEGTRRKVEVIELDSD